jgi:hypothetical protein
MSAWRRAYLLLLLAVTAAVLGCSSGGSAGGQPEPRATIQKITPSARVYTADDLRAAGLRVSRDYDVAGLPLATSAHHGFLNQKEYEARLYASHTEAVALGLAPAEEVTGPDAVLSSAETSWKDGLRDRMVRIGNQGVNIVAKYGDYVIVGNIVLLCEGLDSAAALETCQALVSRLPAQ